MIHDTIRARRWLALHQNYDPNVFNPPGWIPIAAKHRDTDSRIELARDVHDALKAVFK